MINQKFTEELFTENTRENVLVLSNQRTNMYYVTKFCTWQGDTMPIKDKEKHFLVILNLWLGKITLITDLTGFNSKVL